MSTPSPVPTVLPADVREDVRVTRRPSPGVLLVLVVVVSTAARFAAAQTFTIPWIAPDEMLYAMLGESLWDSGTLTIRGGSSPYYSLLTPALVGAPLAASGGVTGIHVAQLLQVAVMSSAAVPVYLWCR